MRVLFDAMGAEPGDGGPFVHARELLGSLMQHETAIEWVVVCDSRFQFKSNTAGVTISRWPGRSSLQRALVQLAVIPVLARLHRVDWVLSTSPALSPLIKSSRTANFIHDWRHIKNPREFTSFQRFYRKQLWVRSVRTADVTFCVSEKTAEETKKLVRGARVVTAVNGSDHVIGRNGSALPADVGQRPFILGFAHRENKRPLLAIQGFVRYCLDNPEDTHMLVLIGSPPKRVQESFRSMDIPRRIRERVLLLGHVSDSLLHSLTSECALLLFPSSEEGFGLPVAEALQLGRPILVTQDSGLSRIFSEGLLTEVAPTAGDIGSGIARVLRLPDSPAQRPKLPTWREACKTVASTMKELGMRRKPKVVWLTNTGSPYRRPVWTSMAETVDLTVFILEANQALARDGARPSDWQINFDQARNMRSLRSFRLPAGEHAFFLLGLRGMFTLLSCKASACVIGGWESPAYWQLLAVAKVKRWRTVAFYESPTSTHRYRNGPIAAARRKFFQSVDAVVVPGVSARAAVAAFGVKSHRVFEGFNTVDMNAFAAPDGASTSCSLAVVPDRAGTDPERGRALGRVYERSRSFIYVGQLIPRKNVDGLLRAFAQLPGQDFSLTIVGDGSERSRLSQLVVDLQLENSVTFVGLVPNSELITIFQKAGTLVLPSHAEVWGLVVNEALAAGLHVVVSRVAGVAASVAHMEGVYLTDPAPVDIARAMMESSRGFRGPIHTPEMLQFTPERFANVFIKALLS